VKTPLTQTFRRKIQVSGQDFFKFYRIAQFPQSYEDITNSQQSSPLLVATDCNPFPLPLQVGNVNKYALQLMGSSLILQRQLFYSINPSGTGCNKGQSVVQFLTYLSCHSIS